jgi:hypothetical protein
LFTKHQSEVVLFHIWSSWVSLLSLKLTVQAELCTFPKYIQAKWYIELNDYCLALDYHWLIVHSLPCDALYPIQLENYLTVLKIRLASPYLKFVSHNVLSNSISKSVNPSCSEK